nr:N-acetylmuramoyl-L-alanine amidase [uncultured Psychroserpens sp.]
MIDYIFYTFISLGCSFLLYFFLLRRQKTFQFNRFYLIVSLSLCLLAPLLEFNTFKPLPSITKISLQISEENSDIDDIENFIAIEETTSTKFTVNDLLWSIYVILSIGFLSRFSKNLIHLLKLTTQSSSRIERFKIIETKDLKNASSFFNYLFINSQNLNDEHYLKSVIKHEQIHSKDLHTIDVIFIELILCFFWFNPFVWLYKRVMIQNHEFIADSLTVKSGFNLEDYSQTIINAGYKEYRVPLTSGFNFIQIKNRIIMLHQSKSSLLKRTLKISTALLIFSCIFIFSCTYRDLNKEPLVVVIDAAHGGNDSGNLSASREEKQIVLQISNILETFSNDKVEIILTRSHDEFLSLRSRVALINNRNPDLFLSLHTNASSNKAIKGIEAYYDIDNVHHDKSLIYAEILIENQLDNFTSRGVKTANFYITKNTTVPGVLLELGFLTNESDRAVLIDDNQQIKIATSIFESLLDIREIK